MGSQTLSSLLVDLKLENAQLKKGIDDANKKLSAFEGQLKKMGERLKGIGQAMNFGVVMDAVGKLGRFVMEGAKAADQMGKLAQSTGVSVESLSKLDYAAGLSGLSTEELASSLGKLDKNLAAAGAGAKDQTAVFSALGVSVKDAGGHVRATDDVLADLAEVFSRMDDGASKTALAMEVFGKSGANLIPFLNQGKVGLAELATEAERLGLVMSAKTAADAERFNDSLDKLHRASNGIAVQVAGKLAPALTRFADELLNSKKGADALKTTVTVLTTFFKILASGAVVLAAAFQAVGTEIAAAAAAIMNIVEGNFSANKEVTAERAKEMAAIWDGLKQHMDAIWSEDTGPEKAMDRIENKSKKSADAALAEFERLKKELDKAARESEFDLSIKSNERIRDAEGRRRGFNDIGAKNVFASFGDPPELKRARQAFKDFDDALDQATQAMIGRDRELAAAALARKAGDEAAAEFALLAADAQAEVAESANTAATAFEESARRQAAAMDGMVNGMVQKMGKTGNVIQSALQGFQAGGIWGAIIAVIVELVSGSKQFIAIIETLDGFLDMIGDVLGGALTSVSEVLRAMQPVFTVIGDLLNSLISFANATHHVSSVFEMTAPIMNLIASILEPITDLIDLFQGLIEGLDFMGYVIGAVSMILNVVGLTVLGTIWALQNLWQGILMLVYGIADALKLDTSGISKLLYENAVNIKKTEDKMANARNSIANQVLEWAGMQTNPGQPTSGGAPPLILTGSGSAADDLSDKFDKLGETVEKVNEQLTNVPAGYKVLEARFAATLATSLSVSSLVDSVKAAYAWEAYSTSGNSYEGYSKFGKD